VRIIIIIIIGGGRISFTGSHEGRHKFGTFQHFIFITKGRTIEYSCNSVANFIISFLFFSFHKTTVSKGRIFRHKIYNFSLGRQVRDIKDSDSSGNFLKYFLF